MATCVNVPWPNVIFPTEENDVSSKKTMTKIMTVVVHDIFEKSLIQNQF